MAARRTVATCLLESVGRNPDRTAFIRGTLQPSIADVLRAASCVARALDDRGVKAGDRVVVWGDGAHPIEWMAAYFGVHLVGAWCAPLSPRITAPEAAFFVQDLEPALVLGAQELVATAGSAVWGSSGPVADRLGGLDFTDLAHPVWSIGSVSQPLGSAPGGWSPGEPHGGDIIYTSGTTGQPKGVVLPSDVQCATASRYADAQTLSAGIVIQSPIPLFTASAIMTLLLPMVTADAVYAIDHPFEPGRSVYEAREHGCEVFKAVPAHYLLIGKAAGEDVSAPAVRLAITTAAPLSSVAFSEIRRLFPRAKVRALFGSTESAGSFTIIEESDLRESLGALGSPAPDVEITLVERETGSEGEEEGDLVLRGPHTAAGYWRRDPMTAAATFLPGGVRTGDRATLRDGRFVLGGRVSGVINRGGFKVDPSEIESVVNAIFWVQDSCVVPVQHPILGEDLLLVVQARKDGPAVEGTATAEALELSTLARALTERLPKQKRPRQVLLCEAFMRNALGKIDRRAVKLLAEARREAWVPLP